MTKVFSRQRLYDVNHAGFVKAAFSRSINSTGLSSEDSIEQELATEFSRYTGIENLIPLSRGRLAIYFGTMHSVTATRRKVIMSAFTIYDLVNMVRAGGGEPVFIDSEPGSVHIGAQRVQEAIDDSTAAVIVTHYHSTNREIQDIADICKANGIALIEDCAIALGAKYDGNHVGSFGDFALFSFGLFKFISTYLGGGIVVRDPKKRSAILEQVNNWPRITASELCPHAAKAWKLSTLTQEKVFSNFTFPLFRFGYTHEIDVIKRSAKNDPNPVLRDSLPEDYRVRPSIFQLNEFIRQIPLVEAARIKRLLNASHYFNKLKSKRVPGLPEEPNINFDCYLNFPLMISNNRKKFVDEMMRSNFDLGIYYYRNCADAPALFQYHKPLPNLASFVKKIVFFPTYPAVDSEYIDRLTDRVADLVSVT